VQRSEERILTTHVGKLTAASEAARSAGATDRGEVIDEAELDREVEAAVQPWYENS
jgi:hypothetical protein